MEKEHNMRKGQESWEREENKGKKIGRCLGKTRKCGKKKVVRKKKSGEKRKRKMLELLQMENN